MVLIQFHVADSPVFDFRLSVNCKISMGKKEFSFDKIERFKIVIIILLIKIN